MKLLRTLRTVGIVTTIVAPAALLSSCASSSESAGSQQLTANVGRYSAPPSGVERPRVGVPSFMKTTAMRDASTNDVAADQATTLMVNTSRFNVIERAQLDQLRKEQGLEDVREDERAASKQVRGVDYLLIGKITNFRVKAEKASRGLGVGSIRLPGMGGTGLFDFKKKSSVIKAEIGVDLRLVDPSSGAIIVAQSKDYTRSDSIGAFGVEILGINADADAELKIDDDNKGVLLRLALDECIRDMLPQIDRHLMNNHKSS